MKIQLNTDHNIQGDESLVRHAEQAVQDALGRFGERITRVEVHVRDDNAEKHGDHDKHCLMEARLEGMQPVSASDASASVATAVTGAARKLQRVVETALAKRVH